MIWGWLMLSAVASVGVEIPYDGLDQDGDGVDLVDVDGDGAPSELVGGPDCNDRSALVGPSVWDVAGDGIDADCDGLDGMSGGPGLRRCVARWGPAGGAGLAWLGSSGWLLLRARQRAGSSVISIWLAKPRACRAVAK